MIVLLVGDKIYRVSKDKRGKTSSLTYCSNINPSAIPKATVIFSCTIVPVSVISVEWLNSQLWWSWWLWNSIFPYTRFDWIFCLVLVPKVACNWWVTNSSTFKINIFTFCKSPVLGEIRNFWSVWKHKEPVLSATPLYLSTYKWVTLLRQTFLTNASQH